MKCNKCNGQEFYQTKNRNKVRFVCKDCTKQRAKEFREIHRDELNQYDKLRGQLPHRKQQAHERLLRKYGINTEVYLSMMENHGYCCAICRGKFTDNKHQTCNIDHNHQTNKVRGLLCGSCNLAIGKMKDSPELLERAATYLRSYL